MKKRVISLENGWTVLLAILMLCLSACGAPADGDTDSAPPENEPAAGQQEDAACITCSTQGVSFQVPADWTRAEGTDLFFATGRPEVYGLNGVSPLGSYTPQEFYEALVSHYEDTNQFSDLQAAESVSAWRSADGVDCYAADFSGCQDSILYCSKLIIAPQKNLVLTFCGQADAETVGDPTPVWDQLNELCESLTFEIGTRDELTGNTFLCGDGSQLCLGEGGDFRWYQSAEDHEHPYYEGVYEVCRGQAAMDKAASMTEYGLTMEELEQVLSASMNGYIPGESRPIDYLYATGELVDDRERYQVCLDTFYAVILHNQRLVTSPEEVQEGGNSTLYIGFYLPELGMADLTNCNAGSNTQWTFQEKTA